MNSTDCSAKVARIANALASRRWQKVQWQTVPMIGFP
jgi:hypothetical protein